MSSERLQSNIEWKKWGEEDPLFGVATWKDKGKDGASPWTDEEFYEIGRSDWGDFWKRWNNYGVSRESCLELGCGAGRITKQLSATFERVYALDVSEGMIRRAQLAVGTNVEFFLIEGTSLPIHDSSVKAVFSTHVLQHLDAPDIGHDYLREFYRVLGLGGTLMIHLPIYSFPVGMFTRMATPAYAPVRKIQDIRAKMERRKGSMLMRGTQYPLHALYSILVDAGFQRVEFSTFPAAADSNLHSFVFATKE